MAEPVLSGREGAEEETAGAEDEETVSTTPFGDCGAAAEVSVVAAAVSVTPVGFSMGLDRALPDLGDGLAEEEVDEEEEAVWFCCGLCGGNAREESSPGAIESRSSAARLIRSLSLAEAFGVTGPVEFPV